MDDHPVYQIPKQAIPTEAISYTAEEMGEFRQDWGRGELVQGKFIKEPAPYYQHGLVESKIAFEIQRHVANVGSGLVIVGEAGVITMRQPDTVRGADVIYISNERFAKNPSEKYIEIAPEIIVEVIGQNDRRGQIENKVGEYIDFGVNQVWVAHYIQKTIDLYYSKEKFTRYTLTDTLTSEDLLPGFKLVLSEVFKNV